jgi:hypothetical protein
MRTAPQPTDALFARSDRGADLSPCGIYRYRLWRELGDGTGTVLFVMLNPSTADGEQDDPTIRRCIGFARSWGFRRLEVANLFALRATDPEQLRLFKGDPIGPETDTWIASLAAVAKLTIAAWGAHAFARHRAAAIADLLINPRCLGTTADGQPRHPLYIPADTTPVEWRPL